MCVPVGGPATLSFRGRGHSFAAVFGLGAWTRMQIGESKRGRRAGDGRSGMQRIGGSGTTK